MKPFESYQHLEGTPLTERDKKELGSKFWNEGKFETFVEPFIIGANNELTFVDMGCNAGVFLNKAEEMGFGRVVGVDFSKEAVERGEKWRDDHQKHYKFIVSKMEEAIDTLPVADYTVLANAHYYFNIKDWVNYLDKLRNKTRFCIIVTAERKNKQACWASSDVKDIERYFKDWESFSKIENISGEGETHARELTGLCFSSTNIERVQIDSLDCGNHVQDGFYEDIDAGKDYKRTRYYRIMKPYRKEWSEGYLNAWFKSRIELFKDVKENGIRDPIYVLPSGRVADGNHKLSMLKYLGYKTVLIRKV